MALVLIRTLIQQRRCILLNIQDSDIRDQAHRAMLDYLRQMHSGEVESISRKGLQRDHPVKLS
jgi:hypothetical protein